MIRTPPASDAYRDNWERVFAEDEAEESRAIEALAEKAREHGGQPDTTDGIHVRIKSYLWRCHTCNTLVSDPENHQYHAIIRVIE